MYTVSNKYKEELDFPLRNLSHVKIVFGVSDPDAPLSSTITDSGHMPWSKSESVDLGFNVSKTYQTLERNRFVLDGKNFLADNVNPIFQGYCGNVISNDDGTYNRIQGIHVSFSEYFEFAGLSIKFDETTGEFPKSFNLQVLNNGVTVLNNEYYPKSTKFVVPDQIPPCNEMLITYLESTIPHRRARITELIYGIIDVLTEGMITDFSFNNSVDLLSMNLPKYEFSFNIFDVNQEFDPEKPNNLLQFLENGQSVKVSLGQELSNGDIEWLPVCNCFTTGDVNVSDAGFVKNISVNATSILAFLNTIYYDGVYNPNGVSLFDMANNVLNFAGYKGTAHIDVSLKNIKSTYVLSGMAVKDCLQLIANASNCTLNITRDGTIEIIPLNRIVTDFNFTFENMYKPPNVKRTPRLKNIISSYQSPKISPEIGELAHLDVDTPNDTDFEITFQTATQISYTVTGTVVVVGTPNFSSNRFTVKARGTGSIIIKGKTITYNQVVYKKTYNELGNDLNVSNTLITNKADCERWCDNIADYFNRRSDYTFEHRGFPYIDMLDNVSVQTNYEGDISGTIIENNLTYNGAINGKTKTLIL